MLAEGFPARIRPRTRIRPVGRSEGLRRPLLTPQFYRLAGVSGSEPVELDRAGGEIHRAMRREIRRELHDEIQARNAGRGDSPESTGTVSVVTSEILAERELENPSP